MIKSHLSAGDVEKARHYKPTPADFEEARSILTHGTFKVPDRAVLGIAAQIIGALGKDWLDKAKISSPQKKGDILFAEAYQIFNRH